MTKERSNVAAFVLTLTLALGWCAIAEAREGWFVGGGLESVSASGGLDGSVGLTNSSGTEAIIPGKLSSGTGWVIDGGYGFNPYIAFEALIARSHHSASNSIGLSDSTADVTNTLIGVRGTYPVIPDKLDLFGRFGLAGSTVQYADYGLQGTTVGNTFFVSNHGSATFTGRGLGYGIGAEYFADHLGIGLGLTNFNISFDQASGITVSGSLASKLNETFTMLDITLLYHY